MIDTEKIKAQLGCDDDFIQVLFSEFINESKESIGKINNALNSKDWPIIKANAHKMLSSTRILDMNNLTDLLKEIEILSGSQEQLERIPELIDELNKEIEITYEELK